MKSHLGDFYRATGRLELRDGDILRVAKLLGLEAHDAASARPGGGRVDDVAGIEETQMDGAGHPVEPTRLLGFLARAVSIGTSTTGQSQPAWFSSTAPFPVENARHRTTRLPLDPLLAPNSARNVVATIAATNVAEGEMDLERIVANVARGEVVRELHRRNSITVRNGLQLLIDRSESMSLFARDTMWVEQEIMNVIGKDRIESLRFAGLPQQGAGRPGEEWPPTYRPPIARVPVLVLTDLGIGDSSATRLAMDWVEFALSVKAAGCPLVVLVPYPPARWPEAAAHAMTIAQWDRSLDARRARMAMRRAQKVLR